MNLYSTLVSFSKEINTDLTNEPIQEIQRETKLPLSYLNLLITMEWSKQILLGDYKGGCMYK